eukprot:gene98-4347_t
MSKTEVCTYCSGKIKNDYITCEICNAVIYCSKVCEEDDSLHMCAKTPNNKIFEPLKCTEEDIKKTDEANFDYTPSKYFQKETQKTERRDEKVQKEIDRILQYKTHDEPYSYYRILKLYKESEDGSFDPSMVNQSQIKRQYHILAMMTHPDQGGHTEAFQIISNAHEVLSDEEKKQNYDVTGIIEQEQDIARELEKIFKKHFTFEVTMKYGQSIHNLIYICLIIMKLAQFFGQFTFGTTMGLWYSDERNMSITIGVVIGWIMYFFSRSFFYTGCLFCFHNSWMSGFLMGFYGYYLRHFVLLGAGIVGITLVSGAVPLKPTLYVSLIGSILGRMIYGYGFIYSFFLSLLLWSFRKIGKLIFGISFIICSTVIDNEKYAAGLTFLDIFLNFNINWGKVFI